MREILVTIGEAVAWCGPHRSRHLNYQLYIREVVQMTAFFPGCLNNMSEICLFFREKRCCKTKL